MDGKVKLLSHTTDESVIITPFICPEGSGGELRAGLDGFSPGHALFFVAKVSGSIPLDRVFECKQTYEVYELSFRVHIAWSRC